jgi:uncharacterized protein
MRSLNGILRATSNMALPIGHRVLNRGVPRSRKAAIRLFGDRNSYPMRVIIPGGSGQIGDILARRFHTENIADLERADVCINLAGRSVNRRYHRANRRQIVESRVQSTRLLNEVIGSSKTPPALWINASTATIYHHALDRAMDEITGELGGNEPTAPGTWKFSIEVAKAWEEATR